MSIDNKNTQETVSWDADIQGLELTSSFSRGSSKKDGLETQQIIKDVYLLAKSNIDKYLESKNSSIDNCVQVKVVMTNRGIKVIGHEEKDGKISEKLLYLIDSKKIEGVKNPNSKTLTKIKNVYNKIKAIQNNWNNELLENIRRKDKRPISKKEVEHTQVEGLKKTDYKYKTNRAFHNVLREIEKREKLMGKSIFAKRDTTFLKMLDMSSGSASSSFIIGTFWADALSSVIGCIKGISYFLLGAAGIEGYIIKERAIKTTQKEINRENKIPAYKFRAKDILKHFKHIDWIKNIDLVNNILRIGIGILVFTVSVLGILVLFGVIGGTPVGWVAVAMGIAMGISSLLCIVIGAHKIHMANKFQKCRAILKDNKLSDYEKYKKYMEYLMGKLTVDEKNLEEEIKAKKKETWNRYISTKKTWKGIKIEGKTLGDEDLVRKIINPKIARKLKRKIRYKLSRFKYITGNKHLGKGLSPEMFLRNVEKTYCALMSGDSIKVKNAIKEAKKYERMIDKAISVSYFVNVFMLILDSLSVIGTIPATVFDVGFYQHFKMGPTTSEEILNIFWSVISIGYGLVDSFDISMGGYYEAYYKLYNLIFKRRTFEKKKDGGEKESLVFNIVMTREIA